MKSKTAFYTCACLWLLGLRSVWADFPSITMLSPPGFQRGSETEMVIAGARLQDATELLLYDPGVEVVELKAEAENKVRVKLRVSEDCDPGLHAMRLATRTGISNLRYYGVSPMPQVAEAEPNSDFSSPQKVQLNTTINGIVQTEDVDYFAFDLAEGEKVTIEIEGIRLGSEFFDPFVAILNEKRFEVARCDDAPLVQQDCVCSFVAPKAGTYIAEVRESSFGGNARCQYRMHIGNFPRPVAIIPSGGQPGEQIDATVVDASGESWQETIQLPKEPGEYRYYAQRDGKTAPSPNLLRVNELPNVLEQEPDDDSSAMEAVAVPVALNGRLQTTGDVDWFKIKGKKGQTLEYTVYGRRVLRSPVDSWLEIHKASGGRLVAKDDQSAGTPDSVQSFKFPEDGEYLVAIRDQLREGGPQHAYRIEIRSPSKSLELTLDEITTRYLSQVVEVPRGSQMAVFLRANRRGFDGDLNLTLEGAPAGLELTTPVVPTKVRYMPMMIKASADAKVDAALAPLRAQTAAGKDVPHVDGALNQRTMIVRGRNNRDMWGHNSDRLAVAVTEELPFSIELVVPQVPIVRNGFSSLIVRATKKEGWDDRIYLRSLHNIGGLYAKSIYLEKGKTEIEIPLTANAKAAIGTFPITFLARSKSVNGYRWTAAEFESLNMEESYFAMKFSKAVIEQGQTGQFVCGIEASRPPQGKVTLKVVGLPSGITCDKPEVSWTDGMQQVSFPVKIAADARISQYKNIKVEATIARPEGAIMQRSSSGGEIQVVPPAVTTAIAQKQQPAAASSPKTKPLRRLDVLRQQRQASANANP